MLSMPLAAGHATKAALSKFVQQQFEPQESLRQNNDFKIVKRCV
jgi:hypothetical protein